MYLKLPLSIKMKDIFEKMGEILKLAKRREKCISYFLMFN